MSHLPKRVLFVLLAWQELITVLKTKTHGVNQGLRSLPHTGVF